FELCALVFARKVFLGELIPGEDAREQAELIGCGRFEVDPGERGRVFRQVREPVHRRVDEERAVLPANARVDHWCLQSASPLNRVERRRQGYGISGNVALACGEAVLRLRRGGATPAARRCYACGGRCTIRN